MNSGLLFKFIGCFPDYLSALSRALLRFLGTTFVETAVYVVKLSFDDCPEQFYL